MTCRFVPPVFVSLLVAVVALPRLAPAQAPTQPPAQAPPFGYYRYTAYTVLDRSAPGPDSLTVVPNVGGTLLLAGNGSYSKILTIEFPAGLRSFEQTGRVTFAAPDSIAFAFTDAKGPDVQRGTYRYDPATGRLAIRLAGYPPGNEGRYELTDSRHEPDANRNHCGGVRNHELPPDPDEGNVGRISPPKPRPKKPLKPALKPAPKTTPRRPRR